jgi:hypothetical protein
MPQLPAAAFLLSWPLPLIFLTTEDTAFFHRVAQLKKWLFDFALPLPWLQPFLSRRYLRFSHVFRIILLPTTNYLLPRLPISVLRKCRLLVTAAFYCRCFFYLYTCIFQFSFGWDLLSAAQMIPRF